MVPTRIGTGSQTECQPFSHMVIFTEATFSSALVAPSQYELLPFSTGINQVGFRPEYCKARWTADIGDDWGRVFLPLFLETYDGYDK